MLGDVAAVMALGVLAFSGVSHLTALGELRRAVSSHRLWPARAVPLLAVALATAETAIGVVGLVGYAFPDVVALPPLLVAAGATLLLFAVYATVLWKLRPASSCGCSRRDDVVSGWTVARAATFTAAAAYAALAAGPSASGSDRVLAGLVAAGLTMLVWQLPATMARQLVWTSDESGGSVWT